MTFPSRPFLVLTILLISLNSFQASSSPALPVTRALSNEDQVQQMSQVLQFISEIASAGLLILSLISPVNPISISLTCISELLSNVKYMEIHYPSKVFYLLKDQSKNLISLNLGLELPEEISSFFPYHPLPGKFGTDGLSSSFLINFGETIITLTVVLVAIFVLVIIATILKKHKKASLLISKIKSIAKWNLFLLIFCSNYDKISFYSTLELHTPNLDSTAKTASFLSCILINLVAFFILGRSLYLLVDLRKLKYQLSQESSKSDTNQQANKGESYGILFKGLKEESFSHQVYIFLFLIRSYIFGLITGLAVGSPAEEARAFVLLGVGMLIYLVARRPFREFSVFVGCFINEFILLLVNINVLNLAIYDTLTEDTSSSRETAANAIVGAYLIFAILAVVLIVSQIFLEIKRFYKALQKVKQDKLLMRIFILLAEEHSLKGEESSNIQEKTVSSTKETPRFNFKTEDAIEIPIHSQKQNDTPKPCVAGFKKHILKLPNKKETINTSESFIEFTPTTPIQSKLLGFFSRKKRHSCLMTLKTENTPMMETNETNQAEIVKEEARLENCGLEVKGVQFLTEVREKNEP